MSLSEPGVVAQVVEIVQEIVIICIDVSGSMGSPFENDRTRLEAVKQMFYGFRDQTEFYTQRRHRIGLVSYSSRCTLHTQPTADFAAFEADIDAMKAGGGTAIYESITFACDILRPLALQHPSADLRVICLSDGQNNETRVSATEALQQLFNLGAVCDCVIVGGAADADLLKLAIATDGRVLQIRGLADAFECFESESVISLLARRNGAVKRVHKQRIVQNEFMPSNRSTDSGPIPSSSVGGGSVSCGSVIQAPDLLSDMHRMDLASYKALPALELGSQMEKRLRKELLDCQDTATMRVFPMCAPLNNAPQGVTLLLIPQPESIYAGGAFEIRLSYPIEYPFKPPRLQFITPIYHYAVTAAGGICLPLLKDLWSPAMNLTRIIHDISQLVLNSATFDPTCEFSVRSWLSELLRVSPAEYHRAALEFTQANAIESVDAITARLTIPILASAAVAGH